jgi:hypothetical protein
MEPVVIMLVGTIVKFVIELCLNKAEFGDLAFGVVQSGAAIIKNSTTIAGMMKNETKDVSNSLSNYFKHEKGNFSRDQLNRITKVLNQAIDGIHIEPGFLATHDFNQSYLKELIFKQTKEEVKYFSNVENEFFNRLVDEVSIRIISIYEKMPDEIIPTLKEILKRQTQTTSQIDDRSGAIMDLVVESSHGTNQMVEEIRDLLMEVLQQRRKEKPVRTKILRKPKPSSAGDLPQTSTPITSDTSPFYRYLDCLDSVRYAKGKEIPTNPQLRVLYMKIQIIITLLSGDLIVVTENQFFDSQGFLQVFDEISRAAENQPLPFIVAKRDPKASLYDIVAKNIGKFKENSVLETYQLSGWPYINTKFERRISWAESIKNKAKPIDTRQDERIWLDRLFNVFEKLENQTIKTKQVPANSTMDQLYKILINSTDKKINNFRLNIEGPDEILKDEMVFENSKEIIRLIRLCATDHPIENRSFAKAWIKNRLEEAELRIGFLELADLLYNFVLGIASSARIVQMSTFRSPKDNLYIRAAYFLALFVQNEVAISARNISTFRNFQISIVADDWINCEATFDHLSNMQSINKVMANFPWKDLLSCIDKPNWKSSLVEYKKALIELEKQVRLFKKSPRSPIRNQAVESQMAFVSDRWANHIKNSKFLNNKYWHLHPDKICLSVPKGNVRDLPITFQYRPFSTSKWQSISADPEVGITKTIKGRSEFRDINWMSEVEAS